MANFDEAVHYVIQREGGIEDNKNDPGHITNMGISLRLLKSFDLEKLRQYGFSATPETINRADIEQLTPAQAKAIYFGEFWSHAPFDRINNQACCNFIFDSVVNMGIAPAIKLAQRAVWAVAQRRNIIQEDGILGDKTIALINECDIHLLSAMRSERAGDYRIIAEKNPADQAFLDGWMSRSYCYDIP